MMTRGSKERSAMRNTLSIVLTGLLLLWMHGSVQAEDVGATAAEDPAVKEINPMAMGAVRPE